MSYRRVLLLTMSPYDRRDHERFGAQVFLDQGFEVEAWDLTGVLYPERARAVEAESVFDGQRTFSAPAEVERAVAALDGETIAVCLLNFDVDSLWIYEALTRAGVDYALNVCNVPPPGPPPRPLKRGERARKVVDRLLLHPMRTARKVRVSRSILGSRPGAHGVAGPRFIVAGGRKSAPSAPFFSEAEVIWAHTFDYDRFLVERDSPPALPNERFAVFLDHGTPFQPDHLCLGSTPVSPEQYYPGVNALLVKVESETGLPVVIAAHPRFKYREHPEVYDGRRILGGETVRLVRDAELVVAHNSTSLNFAVLFRRPVFFILSRAHDPATIESVAQAFGKRAHLDPAERIDWDAELAVDESAYGRYRENYIKTEGSPELPVWRIVSDRFRQG